MAEVETLGAPEPGLPPAPSVPPTRAGARLYLPELDGLRFVAFLLVFFFHQGAAVGRQSTQVGPASWACVRENGWVGVQLFFILSGYLITTLLLREEVTHGRVDLRAFWIRRILRIWPLYYLVVAITFLAMPALGASGTIVRDGTLRSHFVAFLGFCGNWSMVVLGVVPLDAQSVLWSVCVEEQFYILVPLVVALIWKAWRVPVVVGLMATSVLARSWLAGRGAAQYALQYNTFAQFDTLLGGVLLALIIGPDPRERERTWGPWMRWLQWPLHVFVLWLFTRSHLAHGEAWRRTWDFVAIWLAGAGIVSTAVLVPGWLRSLLAYERFVWLGKISYGLYMYHEVAFWVKNRLVDRVGWFPNEDVLWPLFSFVLTVALASLSYYGFERHFLRLKRGWTRVPSRPE